MAAAQAGPRRHAVRGRRLPRRAHAHRRRHARRRDVPGRHRLPRLQRPHLSAADRALRRARRRERRRARCRSRARIDGAGVEWAGTNLRALFAQPRNALRPAFWRMLARHRCASTATRRAHGGARRACRRSRSANILDAAAIRAPFRDWYLLPMAAAIWSAPRRDILDFPLPTFVRFCHNHGLLQIADRPQWRTVAGGARTYVERIAAQLARRARSRRRCTRCGARRTASRSTRAGAPRERFDAGRARVPQRPGAARCSPTRRRAKRDLLRAVRYQPNRVVLHTDARAAAARAARVVGVELPGRRRSRAATRPVACQLPHQQAAAAAVRDAGDRDAQSAVRAAIPRTVLRRIRVLASAARRRRASRRSAAFAQLQGERRTWFAGAWLGYGFHEDGLALRARGRRRHRTRDDARAAIARERAPRPEPLRIDATPTMTARLPDRRIATIAATVRSRRRRSSHGEITHRRTRPAANAFTYPAFCLRLPLSQLAALPARGIARNRRGARRRSTIATTVRATAAPLVPWIRALLAREGIDADGEIVLLRVSAHAGLRVQSGELLGLPRPRRRRRARCCARSATPSASGTTTCSRTPTARRSPPARRCAARKVFHVSPFCEVKGHYAFRFHFGAGALARAHRLFRRRRRAASRCSRPGSPARATPLDRRRRAACCGATAGSRSAWSRASTGRRCKLVAASACRSSPSPRRRATNDPMTSHRHDRLRCAPLRSPRAASPRAAGVRAPAAARCSTRLDARRARRCARPTARRTRSARRRAGAGAAASV